MQKIAIIGVKENKGYEILNLLSQNAFDVKKGTAFEGR